MEINKFKSDHLLVYLGIIVFICPVFFPDSSTEWIESEGKMYYRLNGFMMSFIASSKQMPIKYYFQILSKDIVICIVAYLCRVNASIKHIKSLMSLVFTFFIYHAFEWVVWANDVNYSWHVIFITVIVIFMMYYDNIKSILRELWDLLK